MDKEKVYQEFKGAVNMTVSQLGKWLKTEESKAVGLDSGDGESTGHKSGEHLIRILQKKKTELTDADYHHMQKVHGYVAKHMAQDVEIPNNSIGIIHRKIGTTIILKSKYAYHHFRRTLVFPELAERAKTGKTGPDTVAGLRQKLADVIGERLRSMDDAGIDRQILSVLGPGANLLQGEAAVELAGDYNDALAGKISGNQKIAAFAHLQTSEPAAAENELERAVTQLSFCGTLINGLNREQFLDAPE